MKNSAKQAKHLVFFTDNEGMNILFPRLMQLLRQRQAQHDHLSLICFSQDNRFAFREEIEVLRARFPGMLLCYFQDKVREDFIETILVTNTKSHIEFHLYVPEEYRDHIAGHLQFLGVDAGHIYHHYSSLYSSEKF